MHMQGLVVGGRPPSGQTTQLAQIPRPPLQQMPAPVAQTSSHGSMATGYRVRSTSAGFRGFAFGHGYGFGFGVALS
jgi:hypothetical protein